MRRLAGLVVAVAAAAAAVYGWRMTHMPARREITNPQVRIDRRAAQVRRALFNELQPVRLANCELRRFGEANDGGYLLCGNLLHGVQSGYSYGISGYDGWGCQIS